MRVFGGEVTGHYYFRDNFYADNGFIPALMILDLMSKKGKSLHELLKPLREKYFISGEINTKVANMDIAGEEDRGVEEDLRRWQPLRARRGIR
jgi:phosphomannomutase